MATVAWLRERSVATREGDGTESVISLTYAQAADAIEKGEHRCKEKLPMNEKMIARARRAMACEGWRWMPGMLAVRVRPPVYF